MKIPFISIEGNLGAGKTSLAIELSKIKNAKLILEEFDDNPFLESFYQDQDKYAFPVELHFMMERVKQMEYMLSTGDLFSDMVISDYIFDKTRLFASNNLSKREYKLFTDIFNKVAKGVAQPDIIVYLHRPIQKLLDNIKSRGRTYESEITGDYLREIEHKYFTYFDSLSDRSILILEMEEVGDIFDSSTVEFIAYAISRHIKNKTLFTLKSRNF